MKDVWQNLREEAIVQYTPKKIIISYFSNEKAGNKITIDKQTKDIVFKDKKGKIVSQQNYLKWDIAVPVNPVNHFFLRHCWYLN